MVRAQITLALGLTLFAGNEAQSQQFEKIITGPNPTCRFCNEERQAKFNKAQAEYEAAFQFAANELREIAKWMKGMGYADPYLPPNGSNGATELTIYDLRNNNRLREGLKWENDFGHYSPEGGIAINYGMMIDANGNITEANRTELRDTLAHELYHAVQQANGNLEGPLWIVESMAVAVGQAWAKRNQFNTDGYAISLQRPNYEYNRGVFFDFLGQDLGSANGVDFFDELEKESSSDGAEGVIWLDKFLKQTQGGLAEYFPQYIARHIGKRELFPESQIQKGKLDPLVSVGQGSKKQGDAEIAPVAGAFASASPEFAGGWTGVPNEERVFINAIALRNPSDPDALSLVVRKEVVTKGERFIEPMFAVEGKMKQPYNIRVVNVSKEPEQSKDQTATVEMETTPVTFELPSCVVVGKPVSVIKEASVTQAELSRAFSSGPHRLQVINGELTESFEVIPAASGEVTVFTNLPTPTGGETRVEVAKSQASSQDCMVRMTTGPGELTYSFDGDYTEFSGGREALYLKDGDVAAWEGNWMAIPGFGKQMLLAGLAKNRSTGTLMRFGERVKRVDEWKAHQMPKLFSERFSWSNLQDARTEKGQPAQRSRAACPAGKSEKYAPCSTTAFSMDGEQVTVIFANGGAPLQIKLSTETVEFDYGTFNIRRPPGW